MSSAPIDPTAVDQATRRLLRAPGPPWLAQAVARRMGERLALIRLQPAVVVDASGPLGASSAVLAQAYPAAAVHQLQEPARLRASPAAPAPTLTPTSRRWWAPWRPAASAPPPMGLLAGARPLEPDAAWPQGVQLVWCNLRLGTRADPPAELARWHDAVEPGGFVMFSTLGPDTLRELAAVYQRHGWGPAAARHTDMHDYGDMLVRAGFADPVMDQERLRLTWPDASALLRDLRALGGNADPARFPGWRTPRWRQTLLDALGVLQGPDGRLALTVEVAYGHAFRTDRASRGGTLARFSVDELRQTARTFQSPIAQGGNPSADLG